MYPPVSSNMAGKSLNSIGGLYIIYVDYIARKISYFYGPWLSVMELMTPEVELDRPPRRNLEIAHGRALPSSND